MARLTLFLLGCLLVGVVAASNDGNEDKDLMEVERMEVLERVAREANPDADAKKKKKRKQKKKTKKGEKKTKKGKGRKKNKKGKKKGKKSSKTKGRSGGCIKGGRAVTATCVDNACESLQARNIQMSNFIKQTKKMVNQAKIQAGKMGKNDKFLNDSNRLTQVLGGDTSNPTCANATNAAAAAAVALELKNCSTKIMAGCPTITDHVSIISSCNASVYAFKDKVAECIGKTSDAACTCWAAAQAQVAKVKECVKNSTTAKNAVKAKLTTCKSTFGECKKSQDKTVGFMGGCHTGASGTTASSSGTTGSGRRAHRLRAMLEKNRQMKQRFNMAQQKLV